MNDPREMLGRALREPGVTEALDALIDPMTLLFCGIAAGVTIAQMLGDRAKARALEGMVEERVAADNAELRMLRAERAARALPEARGASD